MVDLLVAIAAQIQISEALLVIEGLDGRLADHFHGVSEVLEAHRPAAGAKSDRGRIRHVVGDNEGQLAVSLFLTVDVARAALRHLAGLGLFLCVTLHQALQGKVRAAEILQVGEALLDAQVGLPAPLLSVINKLDNVLVGHLLHWVGIRVNIMRKLVLNTPELTVGVELADCRPNAALLVDHGQIELVAVLHPAFQDVAVILEVLLVNFYDYLCGPEHAPRIINTSFIVFEGSDVVFAALSRVLGLAGHVNALLGKAAVALARVPEDNAFASLSDEF